MPRLSIDVSPAEHQQLKVIAALKGQSIKDYVLSRSLSDSPDTSNMSETEALAALKDLLSERMSQETIAISPSEIKKAALRRLHQ